jgi:hypothetical protein
MIGNTTNGITQLKKGLNKGEIVGTIIGLGLFALSVYAFTLSIKVNRLSLKKLENEGYK